MTNSSDLSALLRTVSVSLLVGCLVACQPTPVPIPSAVPVPSASGPSPLFRLWTGKYPPDADYLVSVLAASDAWEEAAHRPLFSWTEGRPVQLMQFPVIDAGSVAPDTATGAITFRDHGLIIFSGQSPIKTRRTVVLHEFGHLLGLHHSTDPASVMYPTSRDQSITETDASDVIALIRVQESTGPAF